MPPRQEHARKHALGPEAGRKVSRVKMSNNQAPQAAARRGSSSSLRDSTSMAAPQKKRPTSPAPSHGLEYSAKSNDSRRQAPILPDKLIKVLIDKIYGQTDERDDLWRYLESYLESWGYSIAWDGDTRHTSDSLPPAPDSFNPQPGQSFTNATLGREGIRWAGPSFWPSLCGAYDREGRFVVIKLLRTKSDELDILRCLSTKPRDKRNHTIPVLDFIEAHAWTLVVMPSWELTLSGSHPAYKPEDYLETLFQCLEGLTFMHELGISHGDIHSLNILLNHVAHFRQSTPRHFFTEFKPAYAYIDFGYSKQFPPGTPRLVSSAEAPLTYAEIPGIKTSSFYDPMAADVYALGAALKEQIRIDRRWCQRMWRMSECAADLVASAVPAYMELLAEMTAEDPSRRITARQALARLATFHRQE